MSFMTFIAALLALSITTAAIGGVLVSDRTGGSGSSGSSKPRTGSGR